MATNALSNIRAPQCGLGEQGSTLVKIAEVNFVCPHCGSLYETVKSEPPPGNVEQKIKCSTCGNPLTTREEAFVLTYFLIRRSIGDMWERLPVGAAG